MVKEGYICIYLSYMSMILKKVLSGIMDYFLYILGVWELIKSCGLEVEIGYIVILWYFFIFKVKKNDYNFIVCLEMKVNGRIYVYIVCLYV